MLVKSGIWKFLPTVPMENLVLAPGAKLRINRGTTPFIRNSGIFNREYYRLRSLFGTMVVLFQLLNGIGIKIGSSPKHSKSIFKQLFHFLEQLRSNLSRQQPKLILNYFANMYLLWLLLIGGSRGACQAHASPYRTQFFCFCIHFH